MDEQFSKFIEVIWKLYINIPLLDAIQVPTYAKYLRDILNNKRPLPSTEVIKLTEECSAAILNTLPGRLASPSSSLNSLPLLHISLIQEHREHRVSSWFI
jgi:hypothetical protein